MSESLARLVADLRRFEGRKVVLAELRREIRKPVPAVRKAIRVRAVATLPHRGGLGTWVSRSSITVQVKTSGRSAGVRLKGGRNSKGGRSDIRAIDRGRLRARSWRSGRWHTQNVAPGFFTQPASAVDQWRDACVTAVDKALRSIHG